MERLLAGIVVIGIILWGLSILATPHEAPPPGALPDPAPASDLAPAPAPAHHAAPPPRPPPAPPHVTLLDLALLDGHQKKGHEDDHLDGRDGLDG